MIGSCGFVYLEGYSYWEAFYMVVITISTVGYAEVQPLSTQGQIFASALIVSNIGIFAYMLAVFSYYMTSGEFFKRVHFSLIGKKIDQLENHVIVCGYGRYGREVADHFLSHNMPFVIVEKDASVVDRIQHVDKKILYVADDATKDEVLQRAGIAKAKALISALPDDAENLFVVLTARQLNRNINIISRASAERSQQKLKLAGANHVIMPEQIGGFYMATLVSKPGATEFFSYLSRELDSDIGFEEINYDTIPLSCRGMSIKDMDIRRATGTNIIAFRPSEGNYIVNPHPDTALEPNTSFIVLGNREQLDALKVYLKNLNNHVQ